MTLTEKLIEIVQEEKKTTLILSELFDVKALEQLFKDAVKDYNNEVLGETEVYKIAHKLSYNSIEDSAAYRLIVKQNEEIKKRQEELL
jgi:hypothetical protein